MNTISTNSSLKPLQVHEYSNKTCLTHAMYFLNHTNMLSTLFAIKQI